MTRPIEAAGHRLLQIVTASGQAREIGCRQFTVHTREVDGREQLTIRAHRADAPVDDSGVVVGTIELGGRFTVSTLYSVAIVALIVGMLIGRAL